MLIYPDVNSGIRCRKPKMIRKANTGIPKIAHKIPSLIDGTPASVTKKYTGITQSSSKFLEQHVLYH